MKKQIQITVGILGTLVLMSFVQCKSSSKTSSSANSSSNASGNSASASGTQASGTASSDNSSNKAMNSNDDKKKVYRLVVYFISKGSGVNSEVLQKLDAYVESHPKKPAVDKIRWGREGEVDYGFMLRELSTKEQDEFVSEVKKIIGRTDLVRVKENSTRD